MFCLPEMLYSYSILGVRQTGEEELTIAGVRIVVPKRGLEPLQACAYQTLNLARLPIPPLRRVVRL